MVRPLREIETWIFDCDNTLYPAHCNLFDQVRARITDFIAQHLGLGREAAREVQKRLFETHHTTLQGLMREHGVDPEAYLAFVHAIDYSPVLPDPDLGAALESLPGRKLIFTNASHSHAGAVLARLGLAEHFSGVFDIVGAAYRPKPDPAIYRALVERFDLDPSTCVFIDDMARNLPPAAELGMTTVWLASEIDWAKAGHDSAHIHHVAQDLTRWLANAGAR